MNDKRHAAPGAPPGARATASADAGLRLNLRRLADGDDEGRRDGLLAGTALTRLAGDVVEGPSDVSWAVAARWQPVAGSEPQLWLQLQAQAQVTLSCQRCLQPLVQALEVERDFRFVRDEAEAERLDENADEDVLAMPSGATIDLASLIEDELILALPLVPRHTACPQPLPVPDAAEDGDDEPRQRPFAVLASLKRPGGGR